MNKPRLVAVTPEEAPKVEDLDFPAAVKLGDVWYASAEELRDWRASQSETASEQKP